MAANKHTLETHSANSTTHQLLNQEASQKTFLEPLRSKKDKSDLTKQLRTLHNAYQEFHGYCVFLRQAHEAVMLEGGIDPNSFTGVSIIGRCLVSRSEEIERRLGEMLEGVEKEA